MLFVQSLLLDMENELSWSLGEPYYVNIFTHILIMMYRNTHGNALSREEDQTRQYDENIFNVASQMIHKIEQRLHIHCPMMKSGLFINISFHQVWRLMDKKMLALFHICRPAMKRV